MLNPHAEPWRHLGHGTIVRCTFEHPDTPLTVKLDVEAEPEGVSAETSGRAATCCLRATPRDIARRLWFVIFGITHQSIKVARVETLDLAFEDPVIVPIVWV